MDTNDSQCPENINSTDCLLRALFQLLNDQQDVDSTKIDWDPINFAFTLLLGILALLFAGAAIIQAILAAGKGKRRCSKQIIGPWSTLTDIHWDWSEMNFQSIARTPVLQAIKLSGQRYSTSSFDGLIEAGSVQSNARDPLIRRLLVSFIKILRDLRDCFQKAVSPQNTHLSSASAAPWQLLFDRLLLNHYSVDSWDPFVRLIASNYLPDDIVAVPAYAQVGAVVVAAVMAGARSLDVDAQHYPILVGSDFQIDFRQHPGLGTVGAYSPNVGEWTGMMRLVREEIQAAKNAAEEAKAKRKYLLWGMGRVVQHASDPASDSLSSRLLPVDLFAKKDQFVASMNYGIGFLNVEENRDLRDIKTKELLEDWYHMQRNLHPSQMVDYFKLQETAASEAFGHTQLLLGLFVDTPKLVPLVFPTATLRTNSNHHLTLFALNSGYFARAPFTDAIWNRGPPWENLMSQFNNGEGLPKWDNFEWSFAKDSAQDRFSDRIQDNPQDRPIQGNSPAYSNISVNHMGAKVDLLSACIYYVHKPNKFEAWFFKQPPGDQDSFREQVREQINLADEWLKSRNETGDTAKNEGVAVEARSILLFNTTLIMSKMERVLEQKNGIRNERDQHRLDSTTPSTIHSNIIQVLTDIVATYHRDDTRPLNELFAPFENELCEAKELAEFVHSADHQSLMERFSVLVDYKDGDRRVTDVDEVLTYRCLLIIMLFRTAVDTTKLLPMIKSGIWDKIVPLL